MIFRLERYWRKLRRHLSRNEWLIYLLGIHKAEPTVPNRGLIILQIDGLSHHQFQQAMAAGNLPFLKKLLARENYTLHDLYSGLPSSTPAVQGELFYGVKQCVPAFSFRQHATGAQVTMLDIDAARRVEAALEATGNPLLRGGSAYCNIFSGGATEAHFCVSSVGWGYLLRKLNPFVIFLAFILNFYSFIRVLALMLIEIVLAVFDVIRGIIAGADLLQELAFIPSRVAICILLRELATIGVKLDAARGLPIIHANFLGYDEQSHRRGPSSAFAHWSLKGIDDAISRIWHSASHAVNCHYDFWIYSDHGQEHNQPYAEQYGQQAQAAIEELFYTHQNNYALQASVKKITPKLGEQSQRVKLLGGKQVQKLLFGYVVGHSFESEPKPRIVAKGPLGFVYSPTPLNTVQAEDLAVAMVTQAHIPLVLRVNNLQHSEQRVVIWCAAGKFYLPAERAKVFGELHPFLDALSEDFISLCQHPDAGDFVICGWRLDQKNLSFGAEYGSHGGPGLEETHAFALLPTDVNLPIPTDRKNAFLRPLDLHQAAVNFLTRKKTPEQQARNTQRPACHKKLRVLTYNVHNCMGMDGQINVERIARVIAQYQPDVVALQELDAGRARSNREHQAQLIAQALQMRWHFHPVIQLHDEAYGNAILSCLPMTLIKAEHFPKAANRFAAAEPRGALWVAVEFNGETINIINTHFGLTPIERRMQVASLLGPQWLGAATGGLIVCGDFNASPWQYASRRLSAVLQDTQRKIKGYKPKNTFAGRIPTVRIDHIYVNDKMRALHAAVPSTALTRVSSDHLPLYVDLELND